MNKPPRRTPYNVGGFAAEIGEQVQRGSRGVLGLGPDLGPTPIGPAPSGARQVVSMYDARPIGGFDFVLSYHYDADAGPEEPFGLVTAPQGYTTVIRRIEVEPFPSVLLESPGVFMLYINGNAVPAWEWFSGTSFLGCAIETFVVAPERSSIRLAGSGGFGEGPEGPRIDDMIVRFSGNLILNSGDQPTEQVGSLPHTVKLARTLPR